MPGNGESNETNGTII